MAKRRNKTKKSKKKIKGRGYFTQYDYNYVVPTLIRNRRRRQSGGFLNRYDFAYPGKDTINQAAKHLNSSAGLIRGAIEELYKTPFRLLGNLGRKKYKDLKKCI